MYFDRNYFQHVSFYENCFFNNLSEMCETKKVLVSVIEAGVHQVGGMEDPPCIKIGYSSRLVPSAEKGLPAMY